MYIIFEAKDFELLFEMDMLFGDMFPAETPANKVSLIPTNHVLLDIQCNFMYYQSMHAYYSSI